MKPTTVTPEEYTILQTIVQNPGLTTLELAQKLKLARGKLDTFVSTLEEDAYVKKETKISETLVLTNRGERALINGIPERVILHRLNENKTIHIATESFSNLSNTDIKAGIGMIRKAGIIKITKGLITVVDSSLVQSFSLDLELGIKAVKSKKQLSKNVEKQLLERKFIEKLPKKTSIYFPLVSQNDLKLIQVHKTVSAVTSHMLLSQNWKEYSFKQYNIDVSPRTIYPGRFHPYREFHHQIRTKLVGYGFKEMKGPLIEQEFWNFDALFSPQDHPARESTDVFLITEPKDASLPEDAYVNHVKATHENGWITGSKGHKYKWSEKKASQLLLRPQGTSISARMLAQLEPPAKYFSIAKCFRPDATDATHGVEFYQVEGIICDEKVTFRDLLGILQVFATDIAGAKKVIFRPDYFPFTTPSVELSTIHPTSGLPIEFGGAGIFRPEVTQPFGLKAPVIAWGIGIDRLFMVKNKIDDIRTLFSQNLQWLRETEASLSFNIES